MPSLAKQVATALRSDRSASFPSGENLPAKYAERYAIVGERAAVAAQKITANVTPKMRGRWSSVLRRVEEGRLTGERAVQALWELADEVGAVAGRYAACHAGCSHCCHIGVPVSATEATLIARLTKHKAVASPREATPERIFSDYSQPCPFLREGRCSIYAARPLACRLHFNLDQDSMLCELVGQSIAVPYLDVSDVNAAYAISVFERGESMADIRDHFPRPRHALSPA